MSITLEARYDKRLGLPSYSSHSYSLTLRVEIEDAAQIESESRRLHGLLQTAVDREIQSPGYLPDNPLSGGGGTLEVHPGEAAESGTYGWQCSNRQRDLILTIAEERQLSLGRVEQIAQQRFGRELRQLTRLQASRIISQLLAV